MLCLGLSRVPTGPQSTRLTPRQHGWCAYAAVKTGPYQANTRERAPTGHLAHGWGPCGLAMDAGRDERCPLASYYCDTQGQGERREVWGKPGQEWV